MEKNNPGRNYYFASLGGHAILSCVQVNASIFCRKNKTMAIIESWPHNRFITCAYIVYSFYLITGTRELKNFTMYRPYRILPFFAIFAIIFEALILIVRTWAEHHKIRREKLARDRGDQSELAPIKTPIFRKKPTFRSNWTGYAGRS